MIKITTFACLHTDVYTVSMSIFAGISWTSQKEVDGVKLAALVYAAILVVCVVAQLFGFEDFLLLVESFWLPGGEALAHFLAGLIVIAEVFALPFLLRMNISYVMRVVSMVMGWLVPLIWLGLSLWLMLTVNAVTNIGILGSVIQVPPSWWVVGASVIVGVLSVGVSIAMWPSRPTTR